MRACRSPGSHRTHRWWSKHSTRGRLITTRAGSEIEQQLDDMLLTAVNLHHDRHGDFLQAVTIPSITNGQLPGQLDSPAMKLWPKGMVLYEVGTTGDHMGAPDRQSGHEGILLRKVVVDELSTGALEAALTRAGFQPQRLSVWLLQVERRGPEELRNIAAEVSECAAQGSLLLGQATGWPSSDVRESLASSGFMGSVTDWHDDSTEDAAVSQRCIFATQQHQFSLAQTGLYNRHVAAANDTDEDFLGNFS